MTEPRFDWEADRGEWERFREMDRKWKGRVDDLMVSQAQAMRKLEERLDTVSNAVVEILESMLSSPVIGSPEVRHGSTCPKAPHDNPNGGYLHAPEDDGPFNDDGVTYCGRCHRFLDPAES